MDKQRMISLIEEAARMHPPPPTRLSYGTAGFRTRAEILPGVMVRVGILAVLRSKQLGQAIGVMVTASHNAEPDNGVKIVDPDGGMLESAWEAYAVRVGNATVDQIEGVMSEILLETGINIDNDAIVFVGHDNRPSSASLVQRVIDGANTVGQPQIINLGLVTTPQLHWGVREYNANRPWKVNEYVNSLTAAFRAAVHGSTVLPVLVDAANGAGVTLLGDLLRVLSDVVQISVRNTQGVINKECGAAIVQAERRNPVNFTPDTVSVNQACCSFDGDGDRVVFFYFDAQRQFHLLDGDKIIALCAAYINDLLQIVGLQGQVTIGVVQTAYANGASTAYLEKAGLNVQCVPTGVKHLHRAAHHFDVGIYFEANGHGTVLISENFQRKVAAHAVDKFDTVKVHARAQLAVLHLLANQAVGDAAADMLLVLAALAHFKWDLSQWDAMYGDLPSRQSVLHVANPSVVTTTDAERKCVTPAGLQEAIDAAVASAPSGRAFVRPSGTEPVVRVYAEAATPQAMRVLSHAVERAVFMLAGGVGHPPEMSA